MVQDHPSVLFVEQDREDLDRILLEIEPILYSISLRSPGAICEYAIKWRPDVIVLSDRVTFRKKRAPAFLAALREVYSGPILILTDCLSENEVALWKERGATDCILHPTRFRDRLDHMTQRILDVTAPDYSKTP